jgi:hypothetical protein
MARPNVEESFQSTIDDALSDLGYPDHVIAGATHTQKVAWLIVESGADVDVSDYL